MALAAYVADPGHSSYALADLNKRYVNNPLPTEAENIAQLVPLMKEKLEQR